MVCKFKHQKCYVILKKLATEFVDCFNIWKGWFGDKDFIEDHLMILLLEKEYYVLFMELKQ